MNSLLRDMLRWATVDMGSRWYWKTGEWNMQYITYLYIYLIYNGIA